MVILFMLYQVDKNKVKLYNIYEEFFNDDKKKVREIYIREKVMEEYLFLKTVEIDQEKIEKNKLPSNVVQENFQTNFVFDNQVKYEGIIIIENSNLFGEQRNIFWKFFLGHLFILVCREDENILQASNFLEILEIVIREDMLAAPDKVLVVMDILMPCGQLMFMTINFAQELIKNIM